MTADSMVQPIRLLIVEDNDAVREAIVSWLVYEYSGYQITGVSSGEGALEAVQENKPNLILMDIGLPGINGIETTRRLQATHPDIPVVIITVKESVSYKNDALDAGAAAYIPKRLMYAELLPTLQNLLFPVS
jgi:DNA-binding NarL/FixJ family response regulator